MNYVALGDSISIDTYSGRAGGGAASQFAKLLPANDFQNLTADGRTTDGVISHLRDIRITPDVVTITAGGNDLLQALVAWRMGGSDVSSAPGVILTNLEQIIDSLRAESRPRIILNTVYDPTDGSERRTAELGLPAWARPLFNETNAGIRAIAAERGLLLSDLETLFRGHGFWSPDPWIVSYIEPNFAGATAIANHWLQLLNGSLK
jgi:lysophospholipase L1-like esterase